MIQSVQRAFALLERVAVRPGGVRLSEVAEEVGLHRSTAHNLLATLEELGYVTQLSRGSAYRVTDKIASLVGPRAEAEQALRVRVRPIMEDLSRTTGETTYLAFASGTDYLCVDAVQSPEPLRLTVLAGEREPLLGTAIGHALLAVSPELAGRVRSAQRDAWSLHEADVVRARETGYALDLDRFHPGVSCVAIPLGRGAAVGVAGPTSRLGEDRLVEIARLARLALSAASEESASDGAHRIDEQKIVVQAGGHR